MFDYMFDGERTPSQKRPISVHALLRTALAITATTCLFLTLAVTGPAGQASSEPMLSAADLFILKSDANPNVRPGGALTYRILYENKGVLPATDVVITDTLPAHTTHLYDDASAGGWTRAISDTMLVWRRDVLSPTVSGSFDVVVRVSEDAPAGASLVNRAEITTPAHEDVTDNNTATTQPTIVRVADVKVAKTGPAEVSSGERITYTIEFGNEGSEPADSVLITDTLPAGVAFVEWHGDIASSPTINGQDIVWQAGALPAATTGSLNVVGDIDVHQPSYSVLTNTVSISTQTPERDQVDNVATSTAVLRAGPPASVHVTVPATVPVGTTLPFTTTVLDRWANAVTDDTPVSFTASELVTSDASAVTMGGVATAALTTGTQVGLAVITATAGSVTGSHTLEVVPGPVGDLRLTVSTPTQTVGHPVDLQAEVLDSYGNPVDAGVSVSFTTSLGDVEPSTTHTDPTGTVTATLTVTRTGTAIVSASSASFERSRTVQFTPGPTEQITVTANPPAVPVDGETSQVLATLFDRYGNRVGDGITVTFASSLGSVNPVTATTVSGRAGTVLQSGGAHGSSVVTATVEAYTGTTQVEFLPADLRIESTHSPSGEILPGTAVTYTITYENAGDAVAKGVVITNELPVGLVDTSFETSGASLTHREDTTYVWDAENLSPGEGGSVVLRGHFDRDRQWPASQLVANIAAIESTTAEGDPADNATSAGNVIITADVFLQTIIDDAGTDLEPGKKIKYLVSLGNDGPALAQGAIITDTLPAYTSLWDWGEIGPGAPGLDYVSDPSDSVQVWQYDGTVDGPNFGQFYVWLNIDAHAPGGEVLRNRIEVSTETPEGSFANNVEVVESRLTGVNLEALATGPATVVPGRMITYTLRYTNTGTLPAEEVTLSNALPAGVSVIHFSEEPDRIEPDHVEWDLGTLAEGLWRQIVVVGRVGADVAAGQTLRNTLSIATTSPESFTGDNTAEASSQVVPDAADNLTLAMDPTTVGVGVSSPLTMTVADQYGNPIDDLTITLTTTVGVVTPTLATTNEGAATAAFIAPDAPAEGVVTAVFEDLADTVRVVVEPGPPSDLQAQAQAGELPADGESTTVIGATVRDAFGNPVHDATPVTFDTDRGSLYNGQTQHTVGTIDGIASTVLRAGHSAGAARVVVSVGTLATELEVELTPVSQMMYVRLPFITRNGSETVPSVQRRTDSSDTTAIGD